MVHRFSRRAGVYTRLDYLPGGPDIRRWMLRLP